jgi:NAD(P)-dependent dehydrogenase (short-subunit alcohol dehydrogenase family)
VTSTLITGANKGLGFEAARRLLAEGHTVWIGARDPGRGEAAAAELGARFLQLDVTDQDSVDAAQATIESEQGALDVLVNNAGIAGQRVPVADTTVGHLRHVYDTNVFGFVRVMQAFTPLLLRSQRAVVVNVSSGMGSLAVTTDPDRLESTLIGLAYPSSKAAVNMLTSQYAKAYPQMRVNAVDPGYTATDLNQHRGTQTVEEGAETIVRAALLGPDGPTGGFFDVKGAEVPW